MTTRATLHELVDRLPEDLLIEAEGTLGRLAADREGRADFWKLLEGAPIEDEELSPKELAALAKMRSRDTRPIFLTEAQLDHLLSCVRDD